LARHRLLKIAELEDEPLLLQHRGFGSREWFDIACDIAHRCRQGIECDLHVSSSNQVREHGPCRDMGPGAHLSSSSFWPDTIMIFRINDWSDVKDINGTLRDVI
jgi:hypothetical protein